MQSGSIVCGNSSTPSSQRDSVWPEASACCTHSSASGMTGTASSGTSALRTDLSFEAIRIARALVGTDPRAEAPAPGEPRRIDRDYAFLLHNWALHPGTYRPDPAIMQDFDLWTFNSKVFPAIEPLVARTGERVRIRIGNLSTTNAHPIHLHGYSFKVTGTDGGPTPKSTRQYEVTADVAPTDRGRWRLRGTLTGEPIDPSRHELRADVKAVTKHLYQVRQENGRWVARVVLDI